MAYDNKGGAANALKYFNDLKEARRGMMMAQQGGEEKIGPYGAIIAPNGDMAIPMSTGAAPKKSYKDMTRKERKAEADRLGIKKISKKYRK